MVGAPVEIGGVRSLGGVGIAEAAIVFVMKGLVPITGNVFVIELPQQEDHVAVITPGH